MEEVLLTFSEIAAAFAGFASIVVIFRSRDQVELAPDRRIAFHSMLLSALSVVFFSLLPLVLAQFAIGEDTSLRIASGVLLLYIAVTFIGGVIEMNRRSRIELSALFFFHAFVAATVVSTQLAVQLGGAPIGALYLIGVFALLIASGVAFYSLVDIKMWRGDAD